MVIYATFHYIPPQVIHTENETFCIAGGRVNGFQNPELGMQNTDQDEGVSHFTVYYFVLLMLGAVDYSSEPPNKHQCGGVVNLASMFGKSNILTE